jgi:hypothetical protein
MPPGGNGTLSLFDVVEFQSQPGLLGRGSFLWMPLSAIIFLVALFAETNRQPFDMPESEADLVGGFHTEYGAFKWGLFFVAEYSHMLIGSGVFVLLFLGGWNPLPWVPLPTSLPGSAPRGPAVLRRPALHRHLPRQGAVLHLPLHVGALDGAALPLRPGDEARLAEAPAARHRQPPLLRDPHRVHSKTRN